MKSFMDVPCITHCTVVEIYSFYFQLLLGNPQLTHRSLHHVPKLPAPGLEKKASPRNNLTYAPWGCGEHEWTRLMKLVMMLSDEIAP